MKSIIKNLVDALHDQPMALALLVLNGVFIGAGCWIYFDMMGRYGTIFRYIAEHCRT